MPESPAALCWPLEQHALFGAQVWLPQAPGTQPAHMLCTVWVPEHAHAMAWSWGRKVVLTVITLSGKACWVQVANPGPGHPSPLGLATPPGLASTLASTGAGWKRQTGSLAGNSTQSLGF